jgi:hypothetical protein
MCSYEYHAWKLGCFLLASLINGFVSFQHPNMLSRDYIGSVDADSIKGKGEWERTTINSSSRSDPGP